MTASARTPGVPVLEDGTLVSTNPVSGEVVGTFPVADAQDLAAAVARARKAGLWWRELGFRGRRERLLRWGAAIARRLPELTALMHAEGGKPVADATVEAAAALE